MLVATLRFPELTFTVNVGQYDKLIANVQALCDGSMSMLSVETESMRHAPVINIGASGVSEADFYTKSRKQLTLALSPEALEHLLFKLKEMQTCGCVSTPEFYEFQAVDAHGIILPKAKTLRTYLQPDTTALRQAG